MNNQLREATPRVWGEANLGFVRRGFLIEYAVGGAQDDDPDLEGIQKAVRTVLVEPIAGSN